MGMMDDTPLPLGNSDEPKRDFAKMLDLNRSSLIKSLVDQMEQAMRDIQEAQEDLKQIVAAAKQHEFAVRDVAAMKSIAKLRLQDKKGDAQEKLEALERIGKAVGFDLFDWAGVR